MKKKNDIIEIPVVELKQLTNSNIFVGLVKIKDLLGMIEFTQREITAQDPFDANSNLKHNSNDYYQRILNDDRTYNIKLFLLKHLTYKFNSENAWISELDKNITPLAVFPSAIILAGSTEDSITGAGVSIKLLDDANDIVLNIEGNFLVVDGQHRLAGFKKILDEVESGSIIAKRSDIRDLPFLKDLPNLATIKSYISNFEMLVTFLVDFDLYEQAEIFATVNFTQKAVNRSFMYDIFGTTGREFTPEKYCHDLVAHLNFNKTSKLRGKIGMLGKNKTFFSQAFFVDAFVPIIKRVPDFHNAIEEYASSADIKTVEPLTKFIKNYLDMVLTILEEYDSNDLKNYNGILLKTTGMGAIIKLIPDVYRRLNTWGFNLKTLDTLSKSDMAKVLMPLNKKCALYFSSDGEYAKGAGKGMQTKLYKILKEKLNL